MQEITSSDGTKIAFETTGNGPVVIIVGGAFNDRNTGAPLAEVLSPQFTVVTYDRRGRGDSGDTAPYEVAKEVEDLRALINAVGGSASAYGISSGGCLILEAAAAGCSLEKLAMFEPPYKFDQGPELAADFVKRLSELTAAGKRTELVEYFMTEAMRIPAQGLEHMRQMPMWPALEGIAHTLVYEGIIMGDRSLPDRIMSVKQPTLVLSSGASTPWLQHTAQKVGESLASGKHETVAGAPHDAAPEILAPVLIPFFAE
jgi:pimeloyl-ACP methyl ester carboxylesterase